MKSNGLGLGTVLFIVFLVLKLMNVINWSWWWITAPLWIPLGIIIMTIIICSIIIKREVKCSFGDAVKLFLISKDR